MNNLKKYKFIWIGTVLSIVILVIYIFVKETENCRLFKVLLNLSFSYLAAVVFYIFQVIIPAKYKEEYSLRLLKKDLINIVDNLCFFISFYHAFFVIVDNELEIKNINDNNTVFYKYKYGDNWILEYKNYKEYLKKFINNIKRGIEVLKNRNSYPLLSSKIHDYISKIELENFDMINAVANIYPLCKNFSNLEEEINKINKYKNELLSIISYEKEYEIVPLNKKEIKQYKEDIMKNKKLLEGTNFEIKY